VTTLCLTHIKGGVTKTTSTINLGYGLAMLGYKVLVIDTDPQSNCTYTLTKSLNVDANGEQLSAGTLYEALIPERPKPLDSLIQQSKFNQNLYFVKSSMWLYSADLTLANRTSRETVLRKAIQPVKPYFDFILIDTSPSIGILTINAWIASDYLLIPLSLTTYSLLGIKILESGLADVRDKMELALPILGVFATLDDHTNESKQGLTNIRQYFSGQQIPVFKTVIPRNITVEESNNRAVPLYEYDPHSAGAIAYSHLLKEVLAALPQEEK
jgi:chromosome partitioning protein